MVKSTFEDPYYVFNDSLILKWVGFFFISHENCSFFLSGTMYENSDGISRLIIKGSSKGRFFSKGSYSFLAYSSKAKTIFSLSSRDS